MFPRTKVSEEVCDRQLHTINISIFNKELLGNTCLSGQRAGFQTDCSTYFHFVKIQNWMFLNRGRGNAALWHKPCTIWSESQRLTKYVIQTFSTRSHQTWNSNMSVCFLASLATSSLIAFTRAAVERLLRGLSDGSFSDRLCWEVVVEGRGPCSKLGCIFDGWLYWRRSLEGELCW